MFKSDVALPEKEGRTLPSWLVSTRLRQSGRVTTAVNAIVDTGAQATVVDRTWAAEQGLTLRESNVVAMDIAGRRIASTIAPNVQLSLGGIETRQSDIVAIEMPELLRRIGVFVIWSPQSTVPPGKLFRFEFRRGTLELDDAGTLAEARTASCVGDRFESAALIVDALVGGHAARVELDSGSNDTAILASSVVGAALSAVGDGQQTTSHGAGGSFTTRELPPQRIVIDGYAREFPMSIIDDDSASKAPFVACRSDGVLGLPLLEDCRLDLTSTHFSLSCSRSDSNE